MQQKGVHEASQQVIQPQAEQDPRRKRVFSCNLSCQFNLPGINYVSVVIQFYAIGRVIEERIWRIWA